jgi:hypothetical protein
MVFVGFGFLASQSDVSLDAFDTTTCRAGITALVGGGTTTSPDIMNLHPPQMPYDATEQWWRSENAACVGHVRIQFAIGFLLLVGGVALFVVRRRLPGTVREARGSLVPSVP